MLNTVEKALMSLVRLGIGHETTDYPDQIDWNAVAALAAKQGLSAIVLDGVQRLNNRGVKDGMDLDLKRQWIGNILHNYEMRYSDYCKKIGELADFYHGHCFRMMVLKGYGLGLNYPVPSHRPCGDIDIWMFGRYKDADAALSQDLSIPVDTSHHHHTTFLYKGYTVENHYDWVNVYGHVSSARIEKVFKSLAMDDSFSVDVDGSKVYLPSPNLHALFLLRHTMSHFASTEMNVRQLLDWGFYVEKHSAEIDWKWLMHILKEFHMTEFFACMNAICVHDLGFAPSIFPLHTIESGNEFSRKHLISDNILLKDRILSDTLSPEFQEPSPSGFLPRILFKYRRWRANAWKHRLCYKESMFSAFLTGLWSHLLKPSSI